MFRIIFSSFLLSTFMFGLYNVGQPVSINDQNITYVNNKFANIDIISQQYIELA